MKTTTLVAICVTLASLVGCGGGGGNCSTGLGAIASGSGACNSTEVASPALVIAAPVANAGAAQKVLIATKVTLDGSKSTDAAASALTYKWVLTSIPTASTAALSSATAASPTFTADLAGAYVASLVVNNGKLDSTAAQVTVTAVASNAAPVANAGAAQNVSTGSKVTLDGSSSTDANNDTLTFKWTLKTKPTGSTAALSSATDAMPTFTADLSGAYVVSLVVNDGLADSPAAQISVTAAVANVAPVANAGVTQKVSTGTKVTLDGSKSTDANNDALTYKWTLTAVPTGSTAALASAASAAPTFTADLAGTYTASLVVNDAQVDSAAAQVTITASVANVAPVANAGVAQRVLTGTKITLDGSKSTDANNDALTYKWALTSVPTSSAAVLSSATDAMPSFTTDRDGTYVASLVVNDAQVDSAAAQVTVTAATFNVAPVANAGLAQSVLTLAKVTLDGSKSTDANNDTLTYKWTLLSVPSGSTATLSSATDSKPKFTADVSGTYVANLIVNDGQVDSTPQQVTITAAVANAVPVANAGLAQNVLTASKVTLDGAKSTDANNDVLSYKWVLFSKPAGSTAALSSDTAAKPTFTADVAGTYVISLVVNDGKDSSAVTATTVTATVGNAVPVADPGANQIVANGKLVTLDGSGSSDANHDALTYQWTLLAKPATSTAALSLATAVKPTFTADVPGTYVASLVVNDGKVNSAAVTVAITSNAAPVAVPGLDQTVKKGALVKLDGSKSTDANNDALTYRWNLILKPLNSTAALSSSTDALPTFTADLPGDYAVTLIVNDGTIDSDIAITKVTATAN